MPRWKILIYFSSNQYFLLFSCAHCLPLWFVNSTNVWHDNIVLLAAFLIFLFYTDHTHCRNHQHYSQYRQRRGKCKGSFVHDRAFVLTAVPVVPPVITYHTPGGKRKTELDRKIRPCGSHSFQKKNIRLMDNWRQELRLHLILQWNSRRATGKSLFFSNITNISVTEQTPLGFNLAKIFESRIFGKYSYLLPRW